jgi:hypothetical protein
VAEFAVARGIDEEEAARAFVGGVAWGAEGRARWHEFLRQYRGYGKWGGRGVCLGWFFPFRLGTY